MTNLNSNDPIIAIRWSTLMVMIETLNRVNCHIRAEVYSDPHDTEQTEILTEGRHNALRELNHAISVCTAHTQKKGLAA